MPNRKVSPEKGLKHAVLTRLNDAKYAELKALLNANPQNDMSTLLRDIIYRKPIQVFTRDKTLDNTMEELSRLRAEIRAIGVNINQITRLFNTYPEPRKKALYAAMAFREHQALEPLIKELLSIISNLAKRWLPE